MHLKERSKMGTADHHLLRHLPIELVRETLSWLPVKSIGRFTCVCKSWYALINDHDFITTHTRRHCQNHRRSNGKTPPALLLGCPCLLLEDSDRRKLALYDLATFREHLAVENPFHKLQIVGSCGGLICLTTRNLDGVYGDDLYLWNPVINRLKPVPNSSSSIYTPTSDNFLKLKTKTPGSRRVIGFGFHKQANAYKIIRIVYFAGGKDAPPAAEVYSLRTDSWTTVKANAPNFPPRLATRFVNGSIYWMSLVGSSERPYFSCQFDFNQEVFQVIQPHFPYPYTSKRTMLLPVVIKDRGIHSEQAIGTKDAEDSRSWDIWMLKNEKAGTSMWTWSKKFHIKLEKEPYMFPWGIIEDAKVLFRTLYSDVFSVDVENQQFEAIGLKLQTCWRAFAFMESLALLVLGPAHLGPAV